MAKGIKGTDGKTHYKANTIVGQDKDGDRWLISYTTKVCSVRGGKLVRHWDGWSVSTAHHVRAFCNMCNVPAPNKAAWLEMKVEQ